VGPATPPASVEIIGKFHSSFAAVPPHVTFADHHTFFADLSRPAGLHTPGGASPPLLNLRI